MNNKKNVTLINPLLLLLFMLAGTMFSLQEAKARWAPGSASISNQFANKKASNFSLKLPKAITWDENIPLIGPTTLFSINTYGGWDVGYEYDFNYNFGEGIDVSSDGWSNPKLMTRTDINLRAGAWLDLTGPGMAINMWQIDPFNIDLLQLIGVGSSISERIELPAGTINDPSLQLQFRLPFWSDQGPLYTAAFGTGIYATSHKEQSLDV